MLVSDIGLCNKDCCCREAHVSQVESFFFTMGIAAAILYVLGGLPRNICSRVESVVFSSGNETPGGGKMLEVDMEWFTRDLESTVSPVAVAKAVARQWRTVQFG